VKIQFFKSFILPYIGYCSTLIINFPNYVIQKLHTFYYTFIYKLFDFSFHKKSADEVELFLKKYKLFSLEIDCLLDWVTICIRFLFLNFHLLD